jgi:hypothetical protein
MSGLNPGWGAAPKADGIAARLRMATTVLCLVAAVALLARSLVLAHGRWAPIPFALWAAAPFLALFWVSRAMAFDVRGRVVLLMAWCALAGFSAWLLQVSRWGGLVLLFLPAWELPVVAIAVATGRWLDRQAVRRRDGAGHR